MRTSTDDAEPTLDDLRWVAARFGMDKTIAFPSAFHNQFEFAFERPISAGFARLQEIGNMITNLVVGYGLKECPSFELGSFSMHFDTTKTAALKPLPTFFAIERTSRVIMDGQQVFLASSPENSRSQDRVGAA